MINLLLLAGYARVEAVMTFMELPAGYARFEAVMTFMESLIGTHFIRYVGTNMQHIIKETIHLAGTSADWQGVQLPKTVYEGAQQMLLTLSNIHTLNNIENFANTQDDEVTGDVGDFLAGASANTFPLRHHFCCTGHVAMAWLVHMPLIDYLSKPCAIFLIQFRDADICRKYIVWLDKQTNVHSADYALVHDATMPFNLLRCTMIWATNNMSCTICMNTTLITVSCMLAALSAHASQSSRDRLSHNVQDAPWFVSFTTACTLLCSITAADHLYRGEMI